jgi:hypothetical protein
MQRADMRRIKNKMKSKKRKSLITDDHIMAALSKANGIKSGAARILNMSSAWITVRCQNSQKLQDHCIQLIEDRIDRAEQALDRLIEDDNPTACIFALKTKGRKRGYVEHAPIEDVDSGKLKVLSDFFASVGVRASQSPEPKADEPKDPD